MAVNKHYLTRPAPSGRLTVGQYLLSHTAQSMEYKCVATQSLARNIQFTSLVFYLPALAALVCLASS